MCRTLYKLIFKPTVLMAIALVSISLSAFAQSQPNIVFFITDDYGWQDTAVPMWTERTKLNDSFRTPNMARLANIGVSFTNAYTACSVCSASRISILTGQNPVRHGTTFITGSQGKNSKTMCTVEGFMLEPFFLLLNASD